MRVRAGGLALAIGTAAALLAYLPLAVATVHDLRAPGLTPTFIAQNPTDAGVYLAWIRQGAEGHFLTRNLFAPGGPPNHTVYLLFWLLGSLMALIHAPLAPFYGAATVLSGLGLLAAAWWLTGRFFDDVRVRRAGFALAALSGGLGWSFVPSLGSTSDALPIDFTQPEATTFGSLKTPIFALSQILMILIVGSLWTAIRDRTWRPLLVALPSAALLANSHTYDVISLGAAWVVWLALRWTTQRRIDGLEAAQTAVVAVAVAVPTALNFVALRETGVLAQRTVAPTPAHPPFLVLLGYGLLVPLAAMGFWSGRRSEGLRLLAAWAVVPLLIQYLPTSIQRKLVMGVHLPIALLAGLGLALLWQSKRPWRRWIGFAATTMTFLTPFVLTGEDLRAALDPKGDPGRETLLADERRAMEWIREHAPPDAVVEPMPRFKAGDDGDWNLESSALDLMTPGYTGRSVECGHWCETPGFQAKLDDWQTFAEADTDDADRRAILRKKGVDLIVISDREAPPTPDLAFEAWRTEPPDFLRPIPEASKGSVRVYRVELGADRGERRFNESETGR